MENESSGLARIQTSSKAAANQVTVWQKLVFCELSRSVVSDSLWSHGLYSSWNSPGQNIAVGSLSLLQGIFPIQGSNPGLLHCRWTLYQLGNELSVSECSDSSLGDFGLLLLLQVLLQSSTRASVAFTCQCPLNLKFPFQPEPISTQPNSQLPIRSFHLSVIQAFPSLFSKGSGLTAPWIT